MFPLMRDGGGWGEGGGWGVWGGWGVVGCVPQRITYL
ncbi:hypothetical protein PCC7424_0105 [Gloeothece citriformis PCC 7424]|uniref:Uncharacterized protein n=1 Tax=Gloeothece citriformis (strain PCC 7424) TaxID=65393 RepID=B7K992_GLOC7|nr:hypothetical protein PCC7424_0105 [Gloeothece citriformis PCC 7424]